LVKEKRIKKTEQSKKKWIENFHKIGNLFKASATGSLWLVKILTQLGDRGSGETKGEVLKSWKKG